MFTIETEKPVESVQEVGSLEHRDTTSSNANKFNLAINEEKHRLQHLRRAKCDGETITWHQRSQLDSADRNHPQRQALQKWSSTTSSIQSLQRRIKRCDYGCWEHWTMRDSRRGAEITVQSMPKVLERWHCILHMWTPHRRWYNRKQEVHLVLAGSLLYPELLHKEGPTTRSQVREERRLQRIPHGKSTSKGGVERKSMKTFTIDLSVTSSSERRWSSWVALKRSFLKWIGFASEDHSHIATKEEIDVYRGNWWIRSNVVNFDTMPTRHQPDFKKALSTLYRLKKAEEKTHYENWSQSSSSWWQWHTTLVGSLLWEFTTKMVTWTLIERGNLVYSFKQLFILWYESQQEFDAQFIVIISVTVNAVYCHRRGCVKRISLDTANHEQNGYVKVYDDNNLFKTKCGQLWHDVHRQAQAQHAPRSWARLARCLDVLSFITHVSHPHWLKSSLESFTFIHIPSMMKAFSLWVARLLLLPPPALPRLFPVLPLHALPTLYSDDLDSMTNNLRDSVQRELPTSSQPHKLFWNAYTWHVLDDLICLWSVNKLARLITKWTKACDKRLNRLISYIHHTCEYRQYCHVGNTAKQCRLGLFQDFDFAGDLEDSKSTFRVKH